jgi:tetratricopeptide (TPR) repeat protein
VPEDRELLAHIRHWLGASLYYIGQFDEAEHEYRQAHKLRKQLIAEQPHNVELQGSLAQLKSYLAWLLTDTGRLGEAAELWQQTLEIDEKLLNDFPDVFEYQRRASYDYERYAEPLTAMHRTPEAETALRRALSIRERIVADLPGEKNVRALVWSHYKLGLLLEATGKSEESVEAFSRAIGVVEKLIEEYPESPAHLEQLGWMLATCPAVQFRNPQRAITLIKQALQHSPKMAGYWHSLGVAQHYAGDPSAAIESLRKSMELGGGGDASQWLFLAMADWKKADRQEARTWYDKAVAWIEKNRAADLDLHRFRTEAEALLSGAAAK